MTQFKAENEEIKNKFRAEGNNLEIEFHKKKEAIKNEKESIKNEKEAIRKKQEAIRKQEEALQKKEEDFEIDYNIKKKELQQRKENEEDELYTKILKKIDEWENEIK